MKKLILVAMVAAVMPFSAFAESHGGGDAKAGAKIFKKCKACHMVGPKAKKRVGPVLNGIIGREAATVEGFKYSKAMKSSGLTWDVETLTAFLKKPKKLVKGTKMGFAGIKKDEQVADVIAYLNQFDAEGNESE